jgi:hypothetical protein
VLSILPFRSMVGLRWSASVITQEHLQNLVSLAYMAAVELATYRVPKDHVSPVPRGICRGMHCVPRARIQCAVPPISLLLVVVLQLGDASLDSFRDLAYGGLHDLV